jgi:hypothetical protein
MTWTATPAVMIGQLQELLNDAVTKGLVSPGIVASHVRLDDGWRGEVVQYYAVAKGMSVPVLMFPVRFMSSESPPIVSNCVSTTSSSFRLCRCGPLAQRSCFGPSCLP